MTVPLSISSSSTLEGDIAPSDITFYRLQCDSEGNLRSYIAEGEILPVATRSFGGIAIFGIHEMGRFYRHVLVQKRYPHHGAVAFGHYGKILFEVLKLQPAQEPAVPDRESVCLIWHKKLNHNPATRTESTILFR